jgi:hypothetical protein
MRAFVPPAALAALLSSASAGPLAARAPAPVPRPEFAVALDAADSAEVYVLRQDLQFVIAPSPLTVRTLGCRYVVHRNSTDWRDLQGALGDIVIRPASRPLHGEIRVGLVLSDRRGVLFEAYSSIVEAGAAPGLSQHREVEISANFARALSHFGFLHPNLASWVVHPMRICPAGSGPDAGGSPGR